MKKYLPLLILFSTCTFATPPTWQIVSEKSSLSFSATQNAAPVTGKFAQFTGEIIFAPEQLDMSSVKITINMNSVDTEYEDLEDTLRTSEWFDVKNYPNAVFESSSFKKVEGNRYSASGTITIRDKSLPITFDFELTQYDLSIAVVNGKVSLKRLDFGVGQGEWKSTSEVEDVVTVNFTITAIPVSSKNQ